MPDMTEENMADLRKSYGPPGPMAEPDPVKAVELIPSPALKAIPLLFKTLFKVRDSLIRSATYMCYGLFVCDPCIDAHRFVCIVFPSPPKAEIV
jgi:hypothetical protein